VIKVAKAAKRSSKATFVPLFFCSLKKPLRPWRLQGELKAPYSMIQQVNLGTTVKPAILFV